MSGDLEMWLQILSHFYPSRNGVFIQVNLGELVTEGAIALILYEVQG